MTSQKLSLLASSLIAIVLSFAGSVFGADASGTPKEQQQGSASFITGGVGLDESEQMKQLAKSYPLHFLFAAKGARNPYLAYVEVQIKDKSGKTVLETNGGPFLLVKLPPGSYTVTAQAEGGTKTQKVQVGKSPQRVLMVWPPLADAEAPKSK